VICDIIAYGRPSVIGAIQGMITGLVAITPAAGVVAAWGAIALGRKSYFSSFQESSVGNKY
jgi:Amt family ammonium transporter